MAGTIAFFGEQLDIRSAQSILGELRVRNNVP